MFRLNTHSVSFGSKGVSGKFGNGSYYAAKSCATQLGDCSNSRHSWRPDPHQPFRLRHMPRRRGMQRNPIPFASRFKALSWCLVPSSPPPSIPPRWSDSLAEPRADQCMQRASHHGLWVMPPHLHQFRRAGHRGITQVNLPLPSVIHRWRLRLARNPSPNSRAFRRQVPQDFLIRFCAAPVLEFS